MLKIADFLRISRNQGQKFLYIKWNNPVYKLQTKIYTNFVKFVVDKTSRMFYFLPLSFSLILCFYKVIHPELNKNH